MPFSTEFLDAEDVSIFESTMKEFGIDHDEITYFRFWSDTNLQLDGDYSEAQLFAFATALKRMREKRGK